MHMTAVVYVAWICQNSAKLCTQCTSSETYSEEEEDERRQRSWCLVDSASGRTSSYTRLRDRY